jgi:hypothetical protein
MPDDSTLRENDVGVLPKWNMGDYSSDPNRYYGRVAYTYGMVTDQPLSVTRMAYADTAGAWGTSFTVSQAAAAGAPV